jgi:anti-anti-sigma factor
VSEVTGFRLVRDDLRAVLSVIGPLDALSGPALAQLVERCVAGEDPVREVEVDLAATSFVTGAGFRSLLEAMARAAARGARLHVAHQRRLVEDTLEVLGLEAVLC